MTVRKHEVLTVVARDDDPKSMIDALSELPEDARLEQVDHEEPTRNFNGDRYGATRVTFTFRREVSDG